MPNRNAASGLTPVSTTVGADWNESARDCYIPSTDTNTYAVGDLVKIINGASIYGTQGVTRAAAGDVARGVVVGFGTSAQQNTTDVIPATKSANYLARIVEGPDTIYSIQEGGTGAALTQADVGKFANLLVAANNGFVSGGTLDNASLSAMPGQFNFQILGLDKGGRLGNTYGAYAKWLVRIASHDLITPTVSYGRVVLLTASRTLVASDNGATLVSNSASAFTLTVPAGLPANFGCAIVQNGSGQITLSGSGATVNNVSTYTKTSGQYATLALISIGTDTYVFSGSGA